MRYVTIENRMNDDDKNNEKWMQATVIIVLLAILAIVIFNKPAHADTPALYAPDGTYLGNVTSNPYDWNSTNNDVGPHGSPYAADSIKNEFGKYGSPYSSQSVNNPYATPSPAPKR